MSGYPRWLHERLARLLCWTLVTERIVFEQEAKEQGKLAIAAPGFVRLSGLDFAWDFGGAARPQSPTGVLPKPQLYWDPRSYVTVQELCKVCIWH